MVAAVRTNFNASFSHDSYLSMLAELDNLFPGALDFRLAETPVFIPHSFAKKMYAACDSIIDLIKDEQFLQFTHAAIPPECKVSGTYRFPEMIAFDFGICENAAGEIEPQLIEMQGFASLYGFQCLYPDILRQHFMIPENYSQYLNGHTRDSYVQLLNEVIKGSYQPHEVILLEIEPHKQKTRIDFYCTSLLTGVKPVCITDLIIEGENVFYMLNDNKIQIRRIYNRMIFDDLHSRNNLEMIPDITGNLNVEWVPHPDWFYRISKYTLPFLPHPNIPETFFLRDIKQLPPDLHNFVLKPLFSFAGNGVIIDIRPEDILNISQPDSWILQRKVNYARIIKTPGTPAAAEVRIMYLWPEGQDRPQPVINLARLSKGKMIGTRFNKNEGWVGGSVAYFERGM